MLIAGHSCSRRGQVHRGLALACWPHCWRECPASSTAGIKGSHHCREDQRPRILRRSRQMLHFEYSTQQFTWAWIQWAKFACSLPFLNFRKAGGQIDCKIEQLGPELNNISEWILGGFGSEMPSSRASLQGSQSFNCIFPTTVSPWDTRTTAGGSSGGSAAALASFQCWLASGTDMGGSVRTPAAFCGTVGFRVSPGRTPTATSGPLLGLHSISGPMARSVRDVALFLDALESSEGWAIEPHSPRCWDVNFNTRSGVLESFKVLLILYPFATQSYTVCVLLAPKECFFENLLVVMRWRDLRSCCHSGCGTGDWRPEMSNFFQGGCVFLKHLKIACGT